MTVSVRRITIPDCLKPPFRWRTIEEAEQYVRLKRGYSRAKYLQFLEFARQHKIQPPPIMSLLPEQEEFSIQLFRTKKKVTTRREYRPYRAIPDENFSKLLAPYLMELTPALESDEYFPLLDSLLSSAELSGRLGSLKEELVDLLHHQRFPSFPGKFGEFLRELLLQQMMGGRRDSKTARLLRMLIAATILFDSDHLALKKALRKDFRLLQRGQPISVAGFELLFHLIPETLNLMLLKQFSRFKELFISQILNSPVPAMVKSNLISVARRSRTFSQLSRALDKSRSYLEKMPLTGEQKRRLERTLSIFQHQENQILRFYENFFLSRELMALRQLYLESRKPAVTISFTTQINRILLDQAVFYLYPTKDYHDFFKGEYSQDCTTNTELAAAHLLTPQFFNLRVFQNDSWIGNIYMLDLTQEEGVLIIDRIQLRQGKNILAPAYYPALHRTLARLFKEVDYRFILVPQQSISNFVFFQERFFDYKKTHPMRPYSLQTKSDAFSRFESWGQPMLIFQEKRKKEPDGSPAQYDIS